MGRPKARLKRTLLYLLVVLVSFAAGVYVGYDWIAKPRYWLAAVGEVFMANQYVMLQYREGSYGEAVEALSAYIDFLNRQKPSSENWKPGEYPWLGERGLRTDKILAWSRLAIVHERNKNEPAAERAWMNAENLAREAKFRDPSRANLRERILRLDEPRKDSSARLPNSTQQLTRPAFGPAAELP